MGTDGQELDNAISTLVAQFDEATHKVHRIGASEPCQWKLDVLASGLYETLKFAGEALLRELVERVPPAGSGDDDIIAWLEAARRLSRLLAYLGVWLDVERALYNSFRDVDTTSWELFADFTKQLSLPPKPGEAIEELFHDLVAPFERWFADGTGALNVYDDLLVLPLPRAIADDYRIEDSDPNVLTALSRGLGTSLTRVRPGFSIAPCSFSRPHVPWSSP